MGAFRNIFDGFLPALNFQMAALPEVAPPKAPTKQSTLPGFRRQVAPSAAAITKPDRRLASSNTLTLRNSASSKAVIRNFAIASPDMSAAVNAHLRVGIPENFVVIARSMDGSINPQATQLAQEILRRVTFVPDYSQGFNATASVYALACSLGKELLYYGAAAMEVTLDKARVPSLFVPVHTPSLKFYEDGAGTRPVQEIGGQEIDLDIPTFLYTSLDQDLLDAYSSSPMESAIQPVLADQEFMNDLRRVLKRAVHPRQVATLVEERIRKAAPPEVQYDDIKLAEFMQTFLNQVQSAMTDLNPEDAIVTWDSVEHSYLEGDQGNVAENFRAVQELLNAKLATGTKAMPAVLGHGQGGNHASTEAILFVKCANALRLHISELFSRALTLSVRLLGEDAYVEFKYDPIDMRPEAELEAYKLMKQNRLTEQLSLGMITDEEAAVQITGNLPPATMPKLSGTMFKGSSQPAENPNSNTSAMDQANTPKSPKQPKSPSK